MNTTTRRIFLTTGHAALGLLTVAAPLGGGIFGFWLADHKLAENATVMPAVAAVIVALFVDDFVKKLLEPLDVRLRNAQSR